MTVTVSKMTVSLMGSLLDGEQDSMRIPFQPPQNPSSTHWKVYECRAATGPFGHRMPASADPDPPSETLSTVKYLTLLDGILKLSTIKYRSMRLLDER